MKTSLWFLAVALVATTLGATSAEAYIGPGVGAGAIAAVVGVLGSIFLALFAVIYYPIKRMLKKRKGTAGDARDDTPQ